MKPVSLERFSSLALLAVGACVLMGKADDHLLQAMDSAVHARLALQATAQGVLPVLPIGDPVTRVGFENGFNDHPITLFYLTGWVMRLFGATAWSARFLASLFGVGVVGLTYSLGRRFFGHATGLIAALFLLSSREFVVYTARFHLDPALLFFILLSFTLWGQQRWAASGIAAGMGLWFKSPVCFLLFPSVMIADLLTGSMSRKRVQRIAVSTALALAVGALIWIAEGLIGGWEIPLDYWRRQVFGTAVHGRDGSQPLDPLFGLKLIGRTFPLGLPFVLYGAFRIVRERLWRKVEWALPLSASLVTLIVITSIQYKFSHYYLPMWPFLSLLAAAALQGALQRKNALISQGVLALGILLPSFLIVTPVRLAPEQFPALRRLMPIIQSEGDCRDRVLFLKGSYPYGSEGDYAAEVEFYTNRKLISVSCDALGEAIKQSKAPWIIATIESARGCISEQVRNRFPIRYQFGQVLLLSSFSRKSDTIDLTPLARELSAPLDCTAPSLPLDRYSSWE